VLDRLPHLLLRLEGLAIVAAAAVLYFHEDFGWILFVALILAPDLSFAGYAFGPKLGAIAYDTEYAMVDRDDDIHLGIHSAALWFGKYDVAAVMACYAITLGLLAWAGQMAGLGRVYYAGLAFAAGIALYHYTLIKNRDREKCFKAFLHNNWFGAAVFAGIALDNLVRS